MNSEFNLERKLINAEEKNFKFCCHIIFGDIWAPEPE